MRFEVPQFIEIEDKIFGPFTWKQFVYLAGGGGAALILFFTLPLFIFAIVGIPIVALAGFLAFHQINNRPFSFFLESFFNYMVGNKLYIWKREHEQVITNNRTSTAVSPAAAQEYVPPTSAAHISSLSRKLELDALQKKEEG